MVDQIRISIGTAIQSGLEIGKPDPNFSTAFLMTYHEDRCEANCAFCPQAQESSSAPHMLSRIGWPEYKLNDFLASWKANNGFSRVCIQALNYDGVVRDVVDILARVSDHMNLPTSVCIHPIKMDEMNRIKGAGAERIGIAFDACTEELFNEIKGAERRSPYRWDVHMQSLRNALDVFGEGNVTTHLIVGLGETEQEAVDFIFDMYELGISVGLFAFTSIRGTHLEGQPQPDLGHYRRIQAIRHLISQGKLSKEQVKITSSGRVSLDVNSTWLKETLSSGKAFRVSGCKGCNRPYYNERPSGPMYNYPKQLNLREVQQAIEDADLVR
ncbi:MAG: radical SAM protein [Candidatus Thorarchaeota archaeon]